MGGRRQQEWWQMECVSQKRFVQSMLGEFDIGHSRRTVHGGRGDLWSGRVGSLSRGSHFRVESNVQQSGRHVSHQGHSKTHTQLAAEHHTRVQVAQ